MTNNPKTPTFYLIAGPNGAGKSTFATQLLRVEGCRHFVNADEIAKRLSPDAPESAAGPAAREALRELRHWATERVSFASETTLAGRSYAPFVRRLLAGGFHATLHYLWLPGSDTAVDRVAQRVRNGGHHIPKEDVHRRYFASLHNLFELYLPLFPEWHIWNSAHSPIRPVASRQAGVLTITDRLTYTLMRQKGSSE